MSYFFKNTRRLSMVLSALLLVITMAAGSFAYMTNGLPAVEKVGNAVTQDDSAEHESDSADSDNDEVAEEEVAEAVPPSDVRGVILTPGTDFIKKEGSSDDEIRAEIDQAVESAKALDMNTAVIDTVYGDSVIYSTSDSKEFSSEFDIMEYLVVKCHEEGMNTYAIFDTAPYIGGTGVSTLAVGGADMMDKLSRNAEEFAGKYGLDGILIDGYASSQADGSYSAYMNTGGAIGFENFMRQAPASVVKSTVKAIQKASPGTLTGLLADAVWANESDNAQGSATNAKYTSLGSGNADTKSYVERGMVDFVVVKAFSSTTDAAEPFSEVVSWWANVADSSGVPMYVMHASSKVGTQEAGWASADQLEKQIAEASELPGFYGSIFNNLQKLAGTPNKAAAPAEAAPAPKEQEKKPEPTQKNSTLVMAKPESLSYTTGEKSVTFAGAADPGSPLTINGNPINTDSNGYFAVIRNLAAGENKYTISQSGKEYNYSITYESGTGAASESDPGYEDSDEYEDEYETEAEPDYESDSQILKEMSPAGEVTAENSMSVTITALAHEDAVVYAVINGEKVFMEAEDSSDGYDSDSSFVLFTGDYVTPESEEGEIQNLGSVVVYASLQGQTEMLDGGEISLNKTESSSTKTPVVVTANQAMTYPPKTTNNIPSAAYYPLPKGALDYAVGKSFSYKSPSTGKTYTYTVLASGMRVESGDIKKTSDKASNNRISGITVSAKNDGYTYVTLKTAQKVSYSFSYKTDRVEILFHNTTKTPSNLNLNSNPLFTRAAWSGGNKLTLTMAKKGGFLGYKGYFDSNGNLVFRFNNPPTSIKNAKIAIDPGHGGKDTGALGLLKDWPEKTINLAIAKKLAAELESRGMKVELLNTAGYEAPQRVVMAENTNADMLISIHNNSAKNTAAKGTEVYYFYPFSRSLALNASANVSKKFSTLNRGAKQSYYHITLSSQMASVLVECGFMTNKSEYSKLVKSKSHTNIAVGIADSIVAALKTANTGVKATGTQSAGSAATAGDDTSGDDEEYEDYEDYDDETDEDSSGSSSTALADDTGIALSKAGYVSLYEDYINIYRGNKQRIEIMSEDDELVRNRDFKWTSDDTSIATVDKYGNVTAKKVGETVITATYGDEELICDVEVTRDKVAVKGIKLDKTSLTLIKGKTEQLKLTFNPSNATNKTVRWTSNKSSVASVDSKGVVTARNQGTVTITARTSDGKFTAKCEVEVLRKAVEIEYIELSSDILEMRVGWEDQLGVELYPANATSDSLVWSSSNSNVATVDKDGVIKALKKGRATIKATSAKDKTVYDDCEITIFD